MKYRKEERLKIGQLLYEGKCTKADIMKEYDIANTSINKYLRDYLISIGKLEAPSARIKARLRYNQSSIKRNKLACR